MRHRVMADKAESCNAPRRASARRRAVVCVAASVLCSLPAVAGADAEPPASSSVLVELWLIQTDAPAASVEIVADDSKAVEADESRTDSTLDASGLSKDSEARRPEQAPRNAASSDSSSSGQPRTAKQAPRNAASGGSSSLEPSKSNASGLAVIPDGALIGLGSLKLHVVDGRVVERADGVDREAGPDGGWKLFAAPRIQALVGQEASMTIGQRVPYMVQRDDGSLVVKQSDEASEGITISLLVDKTEGGLVSFAKLDLKLSTVIGRAAMAGVPFDVGRPTLRSVQVSTSLLVREGQLCVIPLPTNGSDDGPGLYLLLRIGPPVTQTAKADTTAR